MPQASLEFWFEFRDPSDESDCVPSDESDWVDATALDTRQSKF